MRTKAKLLLIACLLVWGEPCLFARPEFLARYARDLFAKPEWTTTCATCHINPAGSGPRNEFGRAFARNGFIIMPSLRLQWPDRFIQSIDAKEPLPEATFHGAALKATWAAGNDEAVLVDIGGERFLLNRVRGTIEKAEKEQVQAYLTEPPPPSESSAVPLVPLDQLRRLPTFDHYLVNLPTNRARPARSLHLRFTHRFSDPVAQGTGRLRDLFGFDSFSISSFGVEVGLHDRIGFMTYRSPYPHSFGGPTIEMGPIFSLLRQGGRTPLSFSLRATVEGQQNFTERFTANLVPVVSRAFGDRAEVFVVPTFNLAVPRRTLTSDFAFTPGERRDNLVSVGVGASVRIRPQAALVGEWRPRVAGFRGFGTHNTYSFAVQKSTNRHIFALVFSNTQSTTTTRSLTDGLDDLRIGFNLYRRIW